MVKTLLLYDGKMSSAERIAKKLCYIIGNARVAEITEAPEDLSPYGGFCFVFNFYGSLTTGKTKNFLVANRELLSEKRIALVGIGFSDLGYAKYIVDMQEVVGDGEITALFISNENQTVSAGYEVGRFMRAAVRKMDDGELLSEIEKYIRAHSTMALASAADGYVRCTPVAYSYLDQVFYVLTKGGNKFRGIFVNDKVSLAIFDPNPAGGMGSGLQVYGSAQAVPTDSAEYEVIMAAKKLTPEILESMGVTQFLLKITPLKYEFRNEAFEAAGYDALQELNTTFQLKNWEAGAAYAEMEERRLEALKRAAEAEAEEAAEEEAPVPEEEKAEAAAPVQLPEEEADAEVFAEDAQEEDKRYRFFGGGLKKLIEEEEDEGFDFDEEEAEEATAEEAASEEEEPGFVDEAEEEATEAEALAEEASEEEPKDWFAEEEETVPEAADDVFSIHIADPEEFLTREEQEQVRAARQKAAEAARAEGEALPAEAEEPAEEEAAEEPEERIVYIEEEPESEEPFCTGEVLTKEQKTLVLPADPLHEDASSVEITGVEYDRAAYEKKETVSPEAEDVLPADPQQEHDLWLHPEGAPKEPGEEFPDEPEEEFAETVDPGKDPEAKEHEGFVIFGEAEEEAEEPETAPAAAEEEATETGADTAAEEPEERIVYIEEEPESEEPFYTGEVLTKEQKTLVLPADPLHEDASSVEITGVEYDRAAYEKKETVSPEAEDVLPADPQQEHDLWLHPEGAPKEPGEEFPDEPEEEFAETVDPGKDPEAKEHEGFVIFGEAKEGAEEAAEAKESFFREAEDLGEYEEVSYIADEPEDGELEGEASDEYGEESEEEDFEEYDDYDEESEEDFEEYDDYDEESEEEESEEEESEEEEFEEYDDYDEESEEEDFEEYDDYDEESEEDFEEYDDYDEESEEEEFEEYDDYDEASEAEDSGEYGEEDGEDFDTDDLGEEDDEYERRRAARKARNSEKAMGWKERLLKFFHLNETEEKEADEEEEEDEEDDYEEYGEEEKPETYSAFGYDRDFEDEYDEDEELLHAIPRGKSGSVSSRFSDDDDDDELDL